MNPTIKVLGPSAAIAIAIIIGFIMYGELTRPAGFEGRTEGTWVTGNGIKEGSMFKYRVELPDKVLITTLEFTEKVDNNWKVVITTNNTSNEVILSENLVVVQDSDFDEWEDLRNSLFWLVDFVYEPKPLSGNAIWSTISLELETVDLRLVAKENISTEAGEFEAYKLAYYLGYQGGGELWVVKDMPLPVKAEVLDQDNDLIFRYELLSHNL